MCELYLQALQLSNVLINWTTIKSIHWYLLAEVEVNCRYCSPLGWWWLTQKLIIPPKDYHSAFRVCNSPFFRTVKLFCLGFHCMSRFPLFLTIPFNDGTELQQTPWAFNTLPHWRRGKLCQDSALLLWRRSSQVSHPHAICSAPLTQGAGSLEFCRRTHPGKSVGFRVLQNHCEFGNRFKQQLGAKFSACDRFVMTGAAFQLIPEQHP